MPNDAAPDPGHLSGLTRAYQAAPVTQWMGTTIEIRDGVAEVRRGTFVRSGIELSGIPGYQA